MRTLKSPQFFHFHGDFHQKWHFAHPKISFAHPELLFLAKPMFHPTHYWALSTNNKNGPWPQRCYSSFHSKRIIWLRTNLLLSAIYMCIIKPTGRSMYIDCMVLTVWTYLKKCENIFALFMILWPWNFIGCWDEFNPLNLFEKKMWKYICTFYDSLTLEFHRVLRLILKEGISQTVKLLI